MKSMKHDDVYIKHEATYGTSVATDATYEVRSYESADIHPNKSQHADMDNKVNDEKHSEMPSDMNERLYVQLKSQTSL